jgi:hypothetical protein
MDPILMESSPDAPIVEYVGFTREATTLTEGCRESPNETKCDIIVRVLRGLRSPESTRRIGLDLGQGAFLDEGENIYLFLSEESKKMRKPVAEAQAGDGELYMDGERVIPSKGSWLQPAMERVLIKVNHRNDEGELISLNAWRQWHVLRNKCLISVGELRDQKLIRKRGRVVASTHLRVEDLI